VSTLVARFSDVCRADPARPLIHLPAAEAAVTASDIWDAHLACSDQLARNGVTAGRLVLSAVANTAAAPAALLACRALGAAIMPLDPCAKDTEIDALIARFGAAALVAEDGVHAASRAARWYPDVAMLKLTSGSTGASKATRTTEAQLIADCEHIVDAMRIRADDTQIAAIPMSHSYGLGNVLLPLLMQGTACVLRESFVPQFLPLDARRFGARIFPAVPFMFQYFLDNPPAGGWPPILQRLISAGAPLPADTVRAFHNRFGVKIHSFYGASETGGIAFDGDDDIDDSGTVGTALPGVIIALRDAADDNSIISDHQPSATSHQPLHGRVHVSSAAVSSGYVDEAGDAFTDGGFLTGDYAEWDACGRLLLRGRVSSFVNVAGRKVRPDEVEAVVRTMPGVADVCVIAAPDAKRGQHIVACIVVDARVVSALTTLAVRRYCAQRLAAFKVPRAIVFVAAMPRTARGKIDRDALDALVRDRFGA
jgi:acyl-CoA synthetase (AMP-forming)/AMP-acid ligase II